MTDEAHHAPARSWLKIYNRIGELLPDWQHLGVTATPIRTKGASDLEAIFGKPVYVKSIFELIVEGYLSPLKGLEVRTEDLRGRRRSSRRGLHRGRAFQGHQYQREKQASW